MGCDASAGWWRRCRCSFNPRTRVGCDTSSQTTDVSQDTFQSTHPRGVRPARAFDVEQMEPVSIHAPAWGATTSTATTACGRDGFNPRTRVGCDCDMVSSVAFFRLFQSTHPRGVRRSHWRWIRTARSVSIHAPAWGATDARPALPGRGLCFNPRTRVGCDNLLVSSRFSSLEVSIHAPAWGATIPAMSSPFVVSRFQSTHPRGVRRDGLLR